MATHYNAFISYKHEPTDIKIATLVQRSLERYTIPEKIQKKTGIKKIERVFRDTSELSLTDDLSDTIKTALDNSDFLIVICSLKTKESEWVNREISYFLKNNPRNKVFTVLVDGEPDQVIPDILKDERESLSCDFRMPPSKSKKIELPRIVSAMIGCSYDELMNRQRAYYMRRLFIILSLVIFLGILFISQLIYFLARINNNYKKALENKSKYLATESEDLLNNQQRITAIQLALAALPSQKNPDMPVIPQAVKALSDSINAYRVPNTNQITASWNYKMSTYICSYDISNDGSHIVLLDGNNVISIYDTKDHKKIYHTSSKDLYSQNVKFINNSTFLVWNYDTINAYSIDGSLLYTSKPDTSYLTKENLIHYDDETFTFIYSNNEYFDLNIITYDAKNGTELFSETYDLASLTGMDYIQKILLSPDKTKIAYQGTMSEDYTYVIGVYDISSQENNYYLTDQSSSANMYWYDNDLLTLNILSDTSHISNETYNSIEISDDDYLMYCINCKTKTVEWETYNSVICSDYYYDFYKPSTEGQIVFYTGHNYSVFDIYTGEILHSYDANNSIVYLFESQEGIISCITIDGYIGTPSDSYDQDVLVLTKHFPNNITNITVNNGFYLLNSDFDNELTYYIQDDYDNNWTPLDNIPNHIHYDSYLDENLMAVININDDGKLILNIIDVNNNDTIKQYELSSIEDDSSYNIMGTYKNKLYISKNSFTTEDDYTNNLLSLWELDLTSDKLTKLFDKDYYTYSNLSPKLYDNYMVFPTCNIESVQSQSNSQDNISVNNICMINLESMSENNYTIDMDTSAFQEEYQYFPDQNIIFCPGITKTLLLNTINNSTIEIETPSIWDGSSYHSQICDNRMFISDGKNSIILIDITNGKKIYEKNDTFSNLKGLYIWNDGKNSPKGLILYDNILNIYDLNNGNVTTKICDNDIWIIKKYKIDKNKTHLFMLDYSNNMFVLDMDEIEIVNNIKNTIGYHEASNRIISFYTESNDYYDATNWGYFKYYSTDDLIKKANEFLNGEELSVAQKNSYGIED
ncbi:MAG: toll/interleukin-1 receptor domain-containing protein [Eubacterium sp.]|nr:toll/interleukin-1 receptor domain-containing protein [Eubacterium sp.]